MAIALYLALGLFAGCLGTLIGAGGGFLLVPILLFLFPDRPAVSITAVSLAVVCLNAASGTAAYARMGRVDFRSGLLFAAAAIPGAVLGALAVTHIPRAAFNVVFGVVLLAISIFLILRKPPQAAAHHHARRFLWRRSITDRRGHTETFAYSPATAASIAAGVGFLSSLLGIGGGIIHVPAMVHFLDFPVHLATATSHFTLAITAATAVATHIADGSLDASSLPLIIPMGLGALIGAQLGARLSHRVPGRIIVLALAAALALVSLRLLAAAIR